MKKKMLALCSLALIGALTGCAQTPAVTAPAAQTTMQAETLRLETGKATAAPTQFPKEEAQIQTPAPTLQETPEAVMEKEPAKTEKQEKPTHEPTGKPDAPKPTKQPETPKPAVSPTSAPTKQTKKPKPTKQTVTPAPTQEQTPEPTKAPASTPEPTPEPTPAPPQEPQMEVMGGGFNSEVLAAVNEARALQGNPALSLDSGLCAKALEHAKEMARQGKAFHSCGGVESVSDSSGSGRTIGTRSAVHASDLELNAGLTSLGVGSVKYNGKQYTCVIGR